MASRLLARLLIQPIKGHRVVARALRHPATFRQFSQNTRPPFINIHIESLEEDHIPVAKALSKRIVKEFEESNVTVSPTDEPKASKDAPFTVIITDRTLEIGVIDLLHFTPAIREELHISNLKYRVLLEFGLAKPEIKVPGEDQ